MSQICRFRTLVLSLFLAGSSLGTFAQQSGILREVYENIAGGAVSDLINAPTFPNNPSQEALDPTFEAPTNYLDNYGTRMRGLITAPETGNYTFWIASDDNSALYISTDETPAKKAQIATVATWTGSREWTKEANQKSAPVALVAGKRYYIEALQKEGGGGDNLAVRWQLPSGAIEEPIPGSRLTPVGLTAPVITQQPTNYTTVEGGSAQFSVQLSKLLGATFLWRKNGVPYPGGTNRILSLAPVPLTDSSAQFQCFITNVYGGTNTVVATLTVNPDVTKPALTSVGNLGDPNIVTVIFSEPVEEATATQSINYQINNGIQVNAARMGQDSRTVVLTTTTLQPATTYTLTVNGVRDRATTPNTIVANSTITFNIDVTPLAIDRLRPPPDPIGPSTRHTPLAISEIMYHPLPRTDGRNIEFVELYNSQAWPEDISGYRFSGAVDFTIPANTVLKPGAYLVIAPNPDDIKAVYSITNVMGGFVSDLKNSSGSIRLHNRIGAVLLDVDYSSELPWPPAADGAGHSLVLARASMGHGDPLAWAASDGIGGSPGRADTVTSAYKSVMINEFLAHTDDPDVDYIELYNYSATAVDLSGCILTDDPTTNKFVIPNLRIIPAGGFMAFDQNELGFRLSAAGETIYFKNPAATKILDCVRFEAQENGVSMGRYPDGAPRFQRLSAKTKGGANAKPRLSDVVINEVMYSPISESDDDEYIELYNRSSQPVNIGKWKFTAGISYTFPLGTTIPGGGYLVVAKNVAHLMTNYPNLTGANAIGDYTGSLGNGGERVALAFPDELVSTNSANRLETNTIHIALDEVFYHKGGRWGEWAGKGGSSLELIDSRADKSLAPNWSDSDETAKSGWTTIESTGVLDNGNDNANSLQIIALGSGGEFLVDNVEVIPSGGSNIVPNGDFENGITGWFAQGNHVRSTLENSGGINNSKCLHVRASAHGDTGANRIRVTFTTGLNSGQTVTIRAKVRWLRGHPEIMFRVHGNWYDATGYVLTAKNLGTPAAPNSVARPNVGPAITDVTHFPVLPAASATAQVIARVNDPDGLSSLILKYRVDPSTNTALISMVNNGAGYYSATLPAQPAGTIVAYRIEATDNFSTPATTTFPNDAPARECLIRWGETTVSPNLGTYRVWMTQKTMDTWSNREHLSNEPLDITFVYNNQRIIYNAGGQYSGSPYHAPGFNSPIGNVCDYVLNFPEDDSFLGESDMALSWPGNGGGDNTYQREDTAYWIGGEIGIPVAYRRHVFLMINGVRRAEVFQDVQQPNGDMTDEYFPDGKGGDLYKIQIWFEFDDPAVAFSGVGANLGVYTSNGAKSTRRYRWNWAKRAVNGSANNYTNLFNLVDVINTSATGDAYTKKLLANVDVQNWLRTYAVEHIVGNNDSYAYGGGQNMYAYKPLNDTWKLMIWDIDFAFQSLTADSDLFSVGGGGVGPNLSHPPFLRMYWQALQDAANGPLTSVKYSALLDPKYAALRAAGANVDAIDSIKSYLAARRTYILNLLNGVAAPFKTTSNGGTDFSTANNQVTFTGTASMDVRKILVNGIEYPVTWTTITNWSISVALPAASNPIVITGYDKNGAFITTASNAFNVTYTGAFEQPEGKVVINEIMYNGPVDNSGFIELLNTSQSMAFDLSGWQMTGVDFTFPQGTILAPGGFGLIAKDANAFNAVYGTRTLLGEYSGKLKNEGETIQLLRPDGAGGWRVVDEVTYGSESPWPASANGGGSSLQLIDATKDNNRIGNWQSTAAGNTYTQKWVYATVSGNATSSLLYMYLQSVGDVYIDDVKLVAGNVAEVGANFVQNGGFETTLTGSWVVSPNHANSVISTDIKHSGNSSLHMITTSGGNSQGTAIWQTLSPSLVNGQPYTLSFWYLQSTNGNLMVLRLSGSGLNKTVSILPDGYSVPIRWTPGAANSVVSTLADFPTIWLNEILPNNTAGIMDRLGRRSPWLELFNGGPNPVSLAGLYLANNATNITQWPLPANASIAPGQFATVWLDGHPEDTIDTEWHANFVVPGQTGLVTLARVAASKTNLVDYLSYGLANANQSWGAYPDGAVANRRRFYFTTPGVTNDWHPAPISVVVNEWMADNTYTIADPSDGKFQDWFELYNSGAEVADLSGYYLTDTLLDKTQFQIPAGYSIPSHGRLLVWADAETTQNAPTVADLHVNFQLSKSGESIALISPEQIVIDNITFGKQTNDISQGRFPDGGATVYYMTNASPRFPNFISAQQNTAPVIDDRADVVIWDSQLLNLTFTATDADLPPQALYFTLDAAPAGAGINPDSGLFSWRAPSVSAPVTNSVTVRVTDNGVPNLSVTKTIRVIVAPYPKSTATTIANGNLSMTWSLYPGKKYQLQFSEGLETDVWIDLGTAFTTNNGTVSLNDTIDSDRKFYRLIEAP